MHIEISDDLAHGREEEEMKNAIREGLLIRDYVNAEISIGKFAELMEMSYEEGRKWLHDHGIATTRVFTDGDLEKADERNYRKVAKELNIPVPDKEG